MGKKITLFKSLDHYFFAYFHYFLFPTNVLLTSSSLYVKSSGTYDIHSILILYMHFEYEHI